MGATAVVHPTDQVLQSYGLGKLDDVSSVSVSKHLESCDSCQRRVAELSTDEFLGRLRNAQVKPPDKSATSWSPSAASSTEGNQSPNVPPPAAHTLPPELVDHPDYEIVRELGRGGMGVVYLASNKLMGRHEVLKVVGRHLLDRPGVAVRFLREIRSAAKLQHANIVAAYSVIRLADSLVLAMEYVKGLDLAKMVKTKGPLPIAHACSFIHHAALGLQHAHERGMVHRDIKPANLILASDGKKAIVKVLDFGLAKVNSEGQTDSGLTREGQMLGTPDYIAPEQIRNAQSADIRADIYSLGCTFYFLLTGGPPFRGEHLWDVYQAHFSMDAGPLNLVRPEVPVELAAVVAKMMAKEPGRRFQTPGEVARALTPFFKSTATQPAGPNAEAPRVESRVASTKPPSSGPVPTPPATRAPAPAPADQWPPKTGADGLAWESLIEIREDEPMIEAAKPKRAEPKPAPANAPARRPPWVWPAIIAASVFGVLALSVIIYVATDNGRIKIVVDGPAQNVTIDGNTERIEGLEEPITLRAGKHELKVVRGRMEVETRSFTIRRGDNQELRIEYEPTIAGSPSTTRPTDPSTKIAPGDTARAAVPERQLVLRSTKERRGLVISGSWMTQGDELVQTSPAYQISELVFGDPNWSHYDLSFEVKKDTEGWGDMGGRRFTTLFHWSSIHSKCWYSGYNDAHEIASVVDGKWSRDWELRAGNWVGAKGELQDGKWYPVSIKVRGKAAKCFFNNNLMFDDVHPSLSQGQIGFGSADAQIRFRRIKITDPNGRVLFEGPPEIDPAAVGTGGSPTSSVPESADQALVGEPPVPTAGGAPSQPPSVVAEGWVPLFDGVTLSGWTTADGSAGEWTVEDGSITCSGRASHLFSPHGDYKNFRYRAEIKINDRGNSGMYFRTKKEGGFPHGYEAQINSTHRDPVKTGSLYNHVKFTEILVPPDTWFTQEVEVVGNHIVIKVNGKTTVDYRVLNNTYSEGHFAFQHHDPSCKVLIRKIEIKELSPASLTAVPRTQQAAAKDVRAHAPRPGEAFVPLFNGKDLTGWESLFQNGSEWKVTNDGVLEGRGGGDGKPAFLVTKRLNFANFRLHIKFRYQNDGAGNLEIRRTPVGKNRNGYLICHGVWPTSVRSQFRVGTVVKMSNRPYGAGINGETKRAEPVPAPLNDWNSLDVTADKNRVMVLVNGRTVAEYSDGSSGWYGAGAISLSALGRSVVQFQEVLIQELPN